MDGPDIVNLLIGVSLAINGWFLKGLMDDQKELRKEQGEHGNRLTRLETVANIHHHKG